MRLDKSGKLLNTSTCVWEALVQLSITGDKYQQDSYGELLSQLETSACMSFQEIGITPTQEGWVIHVNAANEDGKVEILIPKDRNIPVQIRKDTRAISESYERYANR
jgi:hypothetical protein